MLKFSRYSIASNEGIIHLLFAAIIIGIMKGERRNLFEQVALGERAYPTCLYCAASGAWRRHVNFEFLQRFFIGVLQKKFFEK